MVVSPVLFDFRLPRLSRGRHAVHGEPRRNRGERPEGHRGHHAVAVNRDQTAGYSGKHTRSARGPRRDRARRCECAVLPEPRENRAGDAGEV